MIKKQKLIIHLELIPIDGLGPFQFDKEIICDSILDAMDRLNAFQVDFQFKKVFSELNINYQFKKVYSELNINYKIVDYVEENEVCD